jgi:hypothetical protein
MPLASQTCKHTNRTKGFVNEDNMKLYAGCHDCGRMVDLEVLQEAATLGELKSDIQLKEKDKQVDKLCKNCKHFEYTGPPNSESLARIEQQVTPGVEEVER